MKLKLLMNSGEEKVVDMESLFNYEGIKEIVPMIMFEDELVRTNKKFSEEVVIDIVGYAYKQIEEKWNGKFRFLFDRILYPNVTDNGLGLMFDSNNKGFVKRRVDIIRLGLEQTAPWWVSALPYHYSR